MALGSGCERGRGRRGLGGGDEEEEYQAKVGVRGEEGD